MNTALSDTIFYVTGKQGIENATQFELEIMIAEYPYFAPASIPVSQLPGSMYPIATRRPGPIYKNNFL